MNLFVSSPDPVEAAMALDDARVVNQCRETAQLISTALRASGLDAPYRPTHARHPVTLWVINDGRNFLWALDHLRALALEHRHRFPRSQVHLSWAMHEHVWNACSDLPRNLPATFQNSARNALLALDFSHLSVHTAYRMYLRARWALAQQYGSRPPRWTSRGAPEWLSDLRPLP